MHPVWGTFGDTCSGRYFAMYGMWKQPPENGICSKQKCEEKEDHSLPEARIKVDNGVCVDAIFNGYSQFLSRKSDTC